MQGAIDHSAISRTAAVPPTLLISLAKFNLEEALAVV